MDGIPAQAAISLIHITVIEFRNLIGAGRTLEKNYPGSKLGASYLELNHDHSNCSAASLDN